MSAASIDQVRQTSLTLSLVRIATQHHKLSFEMATIRGMRHKLAMKSLAQVQDGSGSSAALMSVDTAFAHACDSHKRIKGTASLTLSLQYYRAALPGMVDHPPWEPISHILFITAGAALLDHLPECNILHADKGYDADAIRRQVEQRGTMPNIPPKANRKWKICTASRPCYTAIAMPSSACSAVSKTSGVSQPAMTALPSTLWLPSASPQPSVIGYEFEP